MVEGQKAVFAEHSSIVERTSYEGVGEGGDHTLVIDRLCEDIVFGELEQASARESIAMTAISEERGEIEIGSGASGDGPVVVIDPIDGSLNARRRLPQHSLSVAVASGRSMSDVEFGYVYDFGADEEFTVTRGAGAAVDGVAVPDDPWPGGSGLPLEVVGLEAADPDRTAAPVDALAGKAHRLRVIGSIAITVCSVAAGRLDGMITLGACRSVDVAAAQLMLRETGGAVSFGDLPLEQCPLDLDARYPVAAACDPDRLEILRTAQELSPALQSGD